jgi:hypothetical protein
MKATVLDLRRRPNMILEAIGRNEIVTLSKRGVEIAYIVPRKAPKGVLSIKDSPAFGIWKDRAEMKDPGEYVQQIRSSPRNPQE